MSTKIYNAWRIPASKIQSFTETMDGKMLHEIAKKMLSGIEGPSSTEPGSEGIKEFQKRVIALMNQNVKESLSGIIGMTDYNFSFVLWRVSRRFALVRCFGDRWAVEVFERRLPKYAEEYHFQNQTDEPEDITRRAWKARERMWDRVYGEHNDHMKGMLVHEVLCSKPTGHSMSELRVLREMEKITGLKDRLWGCGSRIRVKFEEVP